MAACMLAFCLQGCADLLATQSRAVMAHPPAGMAPVAELRDVPFFPQTENQCGPAALATAMGAVGVQVPPQALESAVFLPARQGSLQIEMLAAARRHELVATRIGSDLPSLLREVAAGHAPVVLLNLGLSVQPLWHYAVVVGYDLRAGEAVLRSGTTERQILPLSTLEFSWARSGNWAFVVLPPGQLPTTSDEAAITEALLAFERVAPASKAAQAYAPALAKWPDSLLLGLGLANSLYAAGQTDLAGQEYQRVLQKHDSAAAWNNWATLLSERGEWRAAHDAAMRAVSRARAAEPEWLTAAQATLADIQAKQPAGASVR
ncbi:MAG: PA2778 family cysteine peptidase [Aquabacterium sp.]|uniref:PA2778 family cysteine peptidase n=1 Tax=Aquabacterium sp. TaxID=1872578 RepID=UPI003BC89FA9